MTDYEFIKQFSNIKLTNICKKHKINLSNLLSGVTTDENYRRVKNDLIRELLMIIIQDKQEDLLTLYLYNELLEKVEKENRMLREMI